MNGPIITLGRKYGAGGREIGQILAEMMRIQYYDKELMRLVSDETGIGESFFHVADERPGAKILYKIIKGMKPKSGKPSIGNGLLTDENLFRFQSEVIMKLAEEQESCVLVGRCADYILKDSERVVSIFITADDESRIERIVRRTAYNREEAIKNMKKIDKERHDYYNYYTGKDWGNMDQYDLCINSGVLGAQKSAELIMDYINLKTK